MTALGQVCLLGAVVGFVERSYQVGCIRGKADWRKEEARMIESHSLLVLPLLLGLPIQQHLLPLDVDLIKTQIGLGVLVEKREHEIDY